MAEKTIGRDPLWARIKGEWWWRVSRKLNRDYIYLAIAMRMPPRLAYWAFVRVFANTEPYDHMDAYKEVSDRWEAKWTR